jgi:hypothetical protein
MWEWPALDEPDARKMTRITVRLVVAATLAGLLGYERRRRGKAGRRDRKRPAHGGRPVGTGSMISDVTASPRGRTSSIGTALIVALGLAGLAACGAKDLSADPDLVERLVSRRAQVVAVHYQGDLGSGPARLHEAHASYLPLDIPLSRTKAVLVDRLATLGVATVRTVERPRFAYVEFPGTPSNARLKRTFGPAVVLDLYAPADEQGLVGRDHLQASVIIYGRLVDLDDGRVLWRQTCRLRSRSSGSYALLMEHDRRLLREMIEDLADRCGAELAAGLTGSAGR